MTQQTTRRLLLAGAAGPVLFSAVWLVEGSIRPGYDPVRSWVSELALSSRGPVLIVACVLSGALIVALGAGLRTAIAAGPAATWGHRLVTVAGSGLVAAGVFVADPGTYLPEGTAPGVTWHGILHDIAGPVMILSVAAAATVYSRRFARAYGLSTAVATVALWVAASVLSGLDHAGVWSPAPAGLAERLSLLTGFAYLVYLAHRVRTAPEPSSARTQVATTVRTADVGR